MIVKVPENNKCMACVQGKRCLEHLALNESLYRKDDMDGELLVAPTASGESDPTSPGPNSPDPLTPPAKRYPSLPLTSPSPAPVSLYPPLPSSPAPSSPRNDQDLTMIQRQGEGAEGADSSGSDEDKPLTLVSHQTRSRLVLAWPKAGKGLLRPGKQKRTVIAPLRQGVGVDRPVFVKVPFSPGDLVIWKQSAGTYTENPDKVARVVKIIMKTQNQDWDDIQVILDTVMDSTKKEMVLRAARERAREDIRNGPVTGTLDYNFPTEDPLWDPNDPSGVDMIRLKKYLEWTQIGVQNAIPKTMNWSKLHEIRQERKKSPTAFLERLKEAARKYTDLQIDTEQAKVQLALIFLGQSQYDIRKKLQKLEGGS
ncbi:hypothetical protein HGM15179_019505 [Zosterops borbonicus]|uniref:Core shell protein Gag P30 domain-containing protein n=1 Tax=Zosterops borbonicus TaxID=364589 RepID=A0A8K1DAH3_9PASS|nr:hypothetical protein HGM15179_019505 [Zosterops borbonicus]